MLVKLIILWYYGARRNKVNKLTTAPLPKRKKVSDVSSSNKKSPGYCTTANEIVIQETKSNYQTDV